jgi:hypothetical protein
LINQDDVQDSRIEYKYLGNAQDIFELIWGVR